MTAANDAQNPSIQVADWVFSHFGSQLGQGAGAAEAPLAIQNTEDLQAANEWLRRERKRLEDYTEAQLARVAGEHQALVSQNYRNEQQMILACQELSRKEELLARHSRALQEQAAELSRREKALAAQLEQWSKAQGELTELREVRAQTEQETAQQQALLAALRAETEALQKSRESTLHELEAMARDLDRTREARAREQALMREHQAQIEQRLRALEHAELGVQRRVAELDDLESRLREEIEEQERRLAAQRREVAALAGRVRQQAQEQGIALAELQG
jgi:chromosome segregation ATPase